MSRFSLAVPWCLLLLVPLSSAQGPGLSFPNSAVNVLNYALRQMRRPRMGQVAA